MINSKSISSKNTFIGAENPRFSDTLGSLAIFSKINDSLA
jgi:hypothetical protein